MTRLDLPDGGWAELANPRKVAERKRRRYIAAVADLSAGTVDLPRNPVDPTMPDPMHFGSAQMDLADRVSDELILCLVSEWSYGEIAGGVLEELPADVFEPIFLACRDLAPGLTPDYGADPDPKARTGGSTTPATPWSTGAPTSATPSSASTS